MKWYAHLSLLLMTMAVAANTAIAQSAELTEKDAAKIASDAVVYGLPLVMMDTTRRVMTNVATLQTNGRAPINQFGNVLKYPTAADKDVVRQNVDTLYSLGWLDLTKEPIILSVPDTNGRYYMMPIIDAWTNIFASVGKRTTGTAEGQFAIVGPHWSGPLPDGVAELRSPTDLVWILGRTQANGPADYQAVNAIQRQYKLVPLSAWGKPYTPPLGIVDSNADTTTPPIDQVSKMDAATFFKTMAAMMKSNPPPERDAPVIAEIAKIGIVPGQDFAMSKLDPQVARGLDGSVQKAIHMLQNTANDVGKHVNGWSILPKNLANFGTDYGIRAVIALIGLGANLPADAIYPTAFFDGEARPLAGAFNYLLHFDQGKTPPNNAFWSVSMYNAQSFFVENPLNRYNIAGWMPLKYNDDGSLDIYVQKKSPGADKESNWLPAPDGIFSVTMRIYWPTYDALDGNWYPPALVRER
jgi:hypothetical protein